MGVRSGGGASIDNTLSIMHHIVMTSRPNLVPLIIADIYELAGAFRRSGEAIARGAGQTQARWQVLSAASDAEKTVPQIARRLGVSRQNVQRIADVLVSEALARFIENPDHRTSPHLVLTDAGRAMLARLTRAAASRHAALAVKLKVLDLAALRGDLRLLQSAVDSLDEPTERAED
jgi:DNA-binding MarR family transcriptional regulator